jgi:hypothetical protein
MLLGEEQLRARHHDQAAHAADIFIDRDDAVNSVLVDILDVCEYPFLPRPRLAINWS